MPDIQCEIHGRRDEAFVCQHLTSGENAGFHWAYFENDPDAVCPDGWCDDCEYFRADEHGWTPRALAFVSQRTVCDLCYVDIRARNWKQDEGAFNQLRDDAVAYLNTRQDELTTAFNLGAYERCDYDRNTGQLIFSHEGRTRVIADVQVVGSLSTHTRTWLWSWANALIFEPVKSDVRHVREIGSRRRYLKLASAFWPAEESDGWEMSAIAARLLEAQGVHRIPDGDSVTFLLMKTVTWARADN